MKTETKLAIAPEAPSVALMLQTMIERGVTGDNVAALAQLVGLHERMEEKRAEREFAEAFAALQSEMPPVKAIRAVPNNDGSVRYKYAPFDEVMAQLKPWTTKYRFSVSVDTEVGDGRVTAICHLTHAAGHSKPTKYAVRIGSGPPKASEAQADGAAYSYAKRGALCSAFNIVVEPDKDGADDARNLGRPITKEQADTLRRGVKEANADESAFLAFAESTTYEQIMDSRYEDLRQMLARKAAKKAPPANLDPVDKDGNFKF